ncbi:hypothetical protein SDC9_181389 [bioreactor metagenome]|uniref:Uncharacterized protein n=1 Tax=bioreactor metagenome TaxID=1076179 RepID=A0A645H4H3_9ZZZZ
MLRYSADETPAQVSAKRVTQRGKQMLLLESASFTPAYSLVYAAIGTEESGVFLPSATDCKPKLPLLLPIDKIEEPVLQIVDALGHMAFFRV